MTIRAIVGLFVYNVVILAAGAGLLWGLRGWRWWTDFVRLAGVGYMLGVASLSVLLTLELVLGIPITLATLLLTCAAPIAAGLVVGRARGYGSPALRPPGWRFPGLSLFAAFFVAGIVVYFETLFRAGRLASIGSEWDSWAFWIPKAEAIYRFGRLEPEFLAQLPSSQAYPPGLSTLQAGAFHAMGSADSVTLHLQYWFLAIGFAAAVAGLLARRVHQAIVYPVLLLVLVAPTIVERVAVAYSDVPLAYQVALAALLLALWLDEQRGWQLAAAAVLLSGAMLTKREGILLAACVLIAAFVATVHDRRTLWKPLAVAGAVAFALSLPWRIWFTAHGLPSDAPDAGYLGAFGYLERVWPSLELVVTTFFDPDRWLLVSVLATVSVVLAALAGAWRLSVYVTVFLGAAIAASTWAIWSNVTLPFTQEDFANPIVRLSSSPIAALAVLTPLLLARAWSAGAPGVEPESDAHMSWRRGFVSYTRWTWVLVAAAALSLPGAMLVGYSGYRMPGGSPRFPTVADCVSPPVENEPIRVVVGYADSYPEALELRSRAVAAGLDGTAVAQDGCGRLRVSVDGVESVAASEPLLSAARRAKLEPTLEWDAD